MDTSRASLLKHFTAEVKRRGETLAAAALTARLDAQKPGADFYRDVAESLLHAGFASTVVAVLDHALERFPDDIELRYWNGNALRMSGRHDAAERDFANVLQRNPTHRDAAFSLAFMLREAGRIYAAADAIVALWQQRQTDLALTLAALDFLRECGAQAQAQTIARHAYEIWPDDARIAANAGEIALALGEFDDASNALHRAVNLDAEQSASWLRLAYCRRYRNPADSDLQLFRSAWSNTELDPASRTCAGFALGKALDDLGDFANAVDVLRAANAMARTKIAWREQIWNDFVDRQIGSPALPTVQMRLDFAPIFIVGMPRTGTTLVATMLGRHRQVRDRGELNWIGAMYAHLLVQGHLHDASALTAVATLVAAQLHRDDAPARYYLDKNPLNFRYLNLIAALFPDARIVHCRRDARDTALSVWSQHFAHEDLGFAYDFSTIAHVAKDHRRLMTHWQAMLPLRVLDLDYEALVAKPAEQMRRLAEFLDIADLPTAQTSAEPGREIVTTASVWQARQPVYTHAVGRWRRYAEYVPELTAMSDADE